MTEHFQGKTSLWTPPVNSSAIFLKLLKAIVHVPTKVGNHAIPLHSHTSNPL